MTTSAQVRIYTSLTDAITPIAHTHNLHSPTQAQ
jgi:hypothetical protein